MKIMLVGRTGTGKTTFKQAIQNEPLNYKKTQAIEFFDTIIDTPGEYVENRSYYRALIVTAVEADIIILFHDCTDKMLRFPPGFAEMFGNKPVIGIVTKIDLQTAREAMEFSVDNLTQAGCKKVFMVSNTVGTGIEQVEEFISSPYTL